MFRGMWVDSRSALKGLGLANPYPRCCDLQTTAVDSTNQAYDVKGYCTISPDNGGTLGPCENQIIPGFSNTMLMVAGGLLVLVFMLGAKR